VGHQRGTHGLALVGSVEERSKILFRRWYQARVGSSAKMISGRSAKRAGDGETRCGLAAESWLGRLLAVLGKPKRVRQGKAALGASPPSAINAGGTP